MTVAATPSASPTPIGRDTPLLLHRQTGMQSSVALAKLHLGCGTTIVPGWINVDGSWNARLAGYPKIRRMLGLARVIPPEVAAVQWVGDLVHHDVRDPFPFESSSMDAVYSSHMLEHLYRSDAEAVIREILRVLRPGGVARIVVPDVRAIVQRYIDGVQHGARANGKPPAEVLNEELLLRDRAPKRGSLPYRLYSAFIDFHSHKWMYDAESLATLMTQAGFVDVAARKLYDSRIEGIEQIEQASRVENGAGICVEGLKPARNS